MRVSVVTICTREKLYDHPRKLVQQDFASLTRRLWREDELGHLRTPVGRFYVGLPQRRLGPGIGVARRAGVAVDLWVLSAGYGLVHEHMSVVPYDHSFNGMSKDELQAWSSHLCLPDTVPMFLEAPADLRLVLLTDPYLRACQLAPDLTLGAPTVFVVSRRMAGRVPAGAMTWVVERGDVRRFSTPAVALRQEIGARALKLVAHGGAEALAGLMELSGMWRDLLGD